MHLVAIESLISFPGLNFHFLQTSFSQNLEIYCREFPEKTLPPKLLVENCEKNVAFGTAYH